MCLSFDYLGFQTAVKEEEEAVSEDGVVETETYSTLVGEVLCLSFDYLGF